MHTPRAAGATPITGRLPVARRQATPLARAAPWLVARIDRLHAVTAGALVAALLGAMVTIDYRFGADVSLGAVYLLPAGLAIWSFGRTAGLATAVVAAICWSAVAQLAPPSGIPIAWAWTLIANALLFVLAALGLGAFQAAYVHERRMARADELTGLPNRHAFLERARFELERARRARRPLSVAFIDLDDFKTLNDQLGHSAGDGALRTVAGELVDGARRVDLVARIGGDEFAVLLPDADAAAAQTAAARLQAATTIQCSVGCVTWLALPSTVDEMLRQADALMYEVKREGQGQLRHHVIGDTVAHSGPRFAAP